jgi:hypothetical protein
MVKTLLTTEYALGGLVPYPKNIWGYQLYPGLPVAPEAMVAGLLKLSLKTRRQSSGMARELNWISVTPSARPVKTSSQYGVPEL